MEAESLFVAPRAHLGASSSCTTSRARARRRARGQRRRAPRVLWWTRSRAHVPHHHRLVGGTAVWLTARASDQPTAPSSGGATTATLDGMLWSRMLTSWSASVAAPTAAVRRSSTTSQWHGNGVGREVHQRLGRPVFGIKCLLSTCTQRKAVAAMPDASSALVERGPRTSAAPREDLHVATPVEVVGTNALVDATVTRFRKTRPSTSTTAPSCAPSRTTQARPSAWRCCPTASASSAARTTPPASSTTASSHEQ